jgi:hypothetical protein
MSQGGGEGCASSRRGVCQFKERDREIERERQGERERERERD